MNENWIKNETLPDDIILFSFLQNMVFLFKDHLPKKILKSEEFQLMEYRLEELKKRKNFSSYL